MTISVDNLKDIALNRFAVDFAWTCQHRSFGCVVKEEEGQLLKR